MKPAALISGWLGLLALSLIATAVSLSLQAPGGWHALGGSVILALAWLKARLVLGRYLGLDQAPFWSRGFNIALALFCTLLLGLYLIPLMT